MILIFKRYYFLFNDLFLITEEITKGHKLLNSYNLNETIVEDNPQNGFITFIIYNLQYI